MTGGWGTPSWMGGDPVVGETFVGDKSPQMARDLLDAAATLEQDPSVVRAVTGGFIVPSVVHDQALEARRDRDGRGF